MISALTMTVAATGIVIITYDVPDDVNSARLRQSRLQTAWHLQTQAKTLMNAGRFREAERLLARSLRTEPDNNTAKRLYARTLYELGNYSAAADIFRQQLARNPQDAVSCNNLGMCLVRMQWFEAGIKELLRARELETEALFIEENLADSYAVLGDVKNEKKHRINAEYIRNTQKLTIAPADAICSRASVKENDA